MNGSIYLRALRFLDAQLTIADAALANVMAAADRQGITAGPAVRDALGQHLRLSSEITQAHIRYMANKEQEDADGNGE